MWKGPGFIPLISGFSDPEQFLFDLLIDVAAGEFGRDADRILDGIGIG
jgi:hypothetical protein